MLKIKLLVYCQFILLLFFPIISHGKPDDCILLGSKPSFIVSFKNKKSNLQLKNLLSSIDLRMLSISGVKFTKSNVMAQGAYIVFFQPDNNNGLIQIKSGCYSQESLDKFISNILLNNIEISKISPNVLMKPVSIKSKLQISSKQWDLLSPPGGIDVQDAWNITTGNSNAIIAVLDTGDLNNSSLNPNIVQAVSFTNNGSIANGAAPSCGSECNAYDHGTHVAGTVSASGILAYGENIFGVAPTSKLIQVNVFSKFTNPADCLPGTAPCLRSYTADQINALEWLAGTQFPQISNASYVVAANMSLGGPGACSTQLQDAFNNVFAKNISVAVAAGNDNVDASTQTPANCNGVFVVAATDRNGFGTYYSNYGNIVSFAAPGGDTRVSDVNGIYSTILDGYGYNQGTSMASPHVAGLTALLYSVDPTLSPSQALNIMQSTATPFPSGGPGDSCTAGKPCGSGIINAGAAVQNALINAHTLNWTPNINVGKENSSSGVTATVTWQPARWQPSNSTGIVYSLYLNGIRVASCTNIAGTSCALTGLTSNVLYTIFVEATDIRNIYGPIKSSSQQFLFPVAPSLTKTKRNSKKKAFIYYNNTISSDAAFSYTANGLPSGARIQLDNSKNRFIITNLNISKRISNVSITAHYGSLSAQSNAVTIPPQETNNSIWDALTSFFRIFG